MIEPPVLVTVALLGLANVGAAGVIAVSGRGRARLAAGFLTASGLAFLTLAAASRADSERVTAQLVAVGCATAALAVTCYPRLDIGHPVDFVAVVALAGACGLLVVLPRHEVVAGTMGTTIVCLLIGHTWWRLERATTDRRALLWLALATGGAALVAGFGAFSFEGAPGLGATAGAVAAVAPFAAVGPAMAVGVSQPDVVDVRGLIVQAAVFAVVLVCYLSLFVGTVSLLDLLGVGPPNIGSLAVIGALAALTVHPLQQVLRGVVDELLFGTRPDPLTAAGRMADLSQDPLVALRTIREALVLPYAALVLDGEPVAVSGMPPAQQRTWPLTLGDGRTGSLMVGLRPGDLALSRGDEHVLSLVAPLLARTLQAERLAAELQESRGQVVTVLEEERRRLRRDLHDGLGPRLSGIAFTSDAVRNLLVSDPAAAGELLRTLRDETTTALAEIRGLVYAMRPPALDELGLVRAVEQAAAGLRTEGGSPMRVTLRADELPQLSAAAEVAAYRIVVEALSNAARHSGADSAEVRITVRGDDLLLEVYDAGRGGADGRSDGHSDWEPGVGLASMRERAAELGGDLTAVATRNGGRVRARLPLGGPRETGLGTPARR